MNLRDGKNGDGMNLSDKLLTYLFLPSRTILTDLIDTKEISFNKEISLSSLDPEISKAKMIFKLFDNVMMRNTNLVS